MNTERSYYILAITNAGKIHLVSRGSSNAIPCNSRNRGFRVTRITRITANYARKADLSSYCGKCFPGGKPTDHEIDRMCAR